MEDPKTVWLIAINIVLGLAVLACAITMAIGILRDVVASRRKRNAQWDELDRDMLRMFGDAAGRDRSGAARTGKVS
jgi:hypothetical protein